jgi:hypothetical protein
MGRNDGHQRGELIAARGRFTWPLSDRNGTGPLRSVAHRRVPATGHVAAVGSQWSPAPSSQRACLVGPDSCLCLGRTAAPIGAARVIGTRLQERPGLIFCALLSCCGLLSSPLRGRGIPVMECDSIRSSEPCTFPPEVPRPLPSRAPAGTGPPVEEQLSECHIAGKLKRAPTPTSPSPPQRSAHNRRGD